MDNGARIVARIPFKISGPEMLTTHSEVATMAYIRKHTDIPVPEVLEWNDCKTNAIGTEYIIMEHVPGIQLHKKWAEMNAVQHMRCVRALAKTIKSMAALNFSAYGSIYFADIQIDPELKISLGEFCLGPSCAKEYWDCMPGESRYYEQKKPNRGPWNDLSQYCTGLLDQGFSRIPSEDAAPKDEPIYRGSISEHNKLLQSSREVIEALQKSTLLQNIAQPTLLHADLHKRNIFASEDDPTVITSIIDWQSTSVEPAFAYASETPDLVDRDSVPGSILAAAGQETPIKNEFEEEHEDAETAEQRRALERDEWGCYQTLEISLKVDAPKEIGLPGECSYQPSAQELAEHTTQYDEFEMVQGFKDLLNEMIDSNSEGWVHLEDWEAAKEEHKDTLEWWLRDADKSDEPGISAAYIEKIWPFDIEKKREE
ncbi:hypothetical protein PVAG01_11373 [Phlyctema vagabunda]|uniref:Altered inheritance of mitochondria protein 9, mitochondrial n=1 Tax=Phlyctema vagabunda TaxID=108571 RepID=A0ABR4P248_9HELO